MESTILLQVKRRVNRTSTNMDLANGILEGLPSYTSQYAYKGLQNFWSLVSLEQARFHSAKTGKSSQYMLFTNVDNQAFTRDFDISKHKSSWRLFDSYYPFAQLLLIRMVTPPRIMREHIQLLST